MEFIGIELLEWDQTHQISSVISCLWLWPESDTSEEGIRNLALAGLTGTPTLGLFLIHEDWSRPRRIRINSTSGICI